MNILFLCKKVPYPPTDGESLVIMNDIRILRTLGHKVSLFCLNTKKHRVITEGYQKLNCWDGFHAEDIDTNERGVLIKAALGSNPFQIGRFYNKDIDLKAANFAVNENAEMIVFQGLAMTQYLKGSLYKSIYRAHNLEYLIWDRLSMNTSIFFKKLGLSFIAQSLKKYEHHQLASMDMIVTLSDDEKFYFQKNYPSKSIDSIPISLPNTFRKAYSIHQKGLLFVGSLDWGPNKEGIEWFLKEIYPSIAHVPLTIAGKGFLEITHPNITVLNNFENIEDIFSQHRIMIVPLLSGGGIRIKILEAMAFGLPFISTTIGAEGILFDNLKIPIRNSAPEWIQVIQDLYTNESKLIEISKELKQHFRSKYSEEIIRPRWKNILEKT